MLTLKDITTFTRLYAANYSISHDLALAGDSSLWSCELIIQPADNTQMDLLRKILRGQDAIADSFKNQVVVRYPVQVIGIVPRVDKIFEVFTPHLNSLVGATCQLQIVICLDDDEYKDSFTRAQKWEWLISSIGITELFLSGVFRNDGVEFLNVLHSCHQADLNRDLTEEVTHIVNNWNLTLHDVMSFANSNIPLDTVIDLSVKAPNDKPYFLAFDDPREMMDAMNLCTTLELVEKYEIVMRKNNIEGRLNVLAMADVLFEVRFGKVFNLFGSDLEQE